MGCERDFPYCLGAYVYARERKNIHISIERERERERNLVAALSLAQGLSSPLLQSYLASEWTLSTHSSPHNWSHNCLFIYYFFVFLFVNLFSMFVLTPFRCNFSHNPGAENLERSSCRLVRISPEWQFVCNTTMICLTCFQYSNEKPLPRMISLIFYDTSWMPQISTLKEKPLLRINNSIQQWILIILSQNDKY